MACQVEAPRRTVKSLRGFAPLPDQTQTIGREKAQNAQKNRPASESFLRLLCIFAAKIPRRFGYLAGRMQSKAERRWSKAKPNGFRTKA